MNLAHAINLLHRYLAPRDLQNLSQETLRLATQLQQVDVMVLFGGSILAGIDEFAHAIKAGVAKHYIIVGGEGHTTAALRTQMQPYLPTISLQGLSEAEIFNCYLQEKYALSADYLETQSTNCGNNITYLLDLLAEKQIDCDSIILMQDATMQRRMTETLRKYQPNWQIINYAAYHVDVNDDLTFESSPLGMWDMTHFINLLLGEIPRLRDDENGYGPNGKGFLAHVEIPSEVIRAYELILEQTGQAPRVANTKFASRS